MKNTILALSALAVILVSSVSFAGFGAIAIGTYDSTRWGVSDGWGDLGSAEDAALNSCQSNGEACYIYSWEQNECIYGPDGTWACN